jgi:AcrR family transcriptional regulator
MCRQFPRMTKQTRGYHHGDLRAALLDEAALMIAEGGAGCLTMRALGQRLGVSRAAAYRHFDDKTALLVAVAASGFGRLEQRLQSVAGDAGAPDLEAVQRMGEAYVRFALENPAHYRLMYSREGLGRRELPELREAGNALFEQLVDVFRVHQERGLIQARDPRGQAYVAWSAVHGLASLLIDGQIMAEVDVDALIGETTRTLLEGMRL